jgi:D-glycero-D-manno-heptose 1,7-bisphosphate phosphatase
LVADCCQRLGNCKKNGKSQTGNLKMESLKPVVFLDRDGTLNVESGYIREVSNLNLIEGAAEAVARFNRAGIVAVLTTNQTGPARGYYSESHIQALHERLVSLLAAGGAHLDAVYYCPHLSVEEGGVVAPYNIACNCRKPGIGMVDKAYSELPGLNKALSFVVGDKATDVELAANCGALGVLVETGYGKDVQSGAYQWPVKPDFQASSIVEAADWIIAKCRGSDS